MYDRVFIYEFAGNLSGQVPLVKADPEYIGFWREAEYSFLFFKTDKKELLRGLFPPFRSELVIRHEDWEAARPLDILRVGRLIIRPPWIPPPPEEGFHLMIDPGMAFGSGNHASTAGCLSLLDRLFRKFAPETVLDLGTGTGILSLACLKMGAARAFSLDYNNLSVETARKNRALNRLEDRMHLWMGDALDHVFIPADLLVANMHFQVIDRILEKEGFYSRKYCLISGLLGAEGELIADKLRGRMEIVAVHEESRWVTYLIKNPCDPNPA